MKAQTTTSKTNQKLALNKKKSTSANVKILKSDSFYDRNDIQSSVVMVTNESKEERKIGLLANHENISELFKKQNMTMEYYIKSCLQLNLTPLNVLSFFFFLITKSLH